ncbi:Fic family protein [Prosthecobacter fusiformis]|uniref:Fic family protein n=1 Tax=Prosthecobacter fusiformis TaxID=48464 RepID=A0A4R7RNT0_9BACT|nr:Fic family protein [Prosthecobacter fusiformis]TDU66468.1 Fic family protein [Prosthecobacter fusiformis]
MEYIHELRNWPHLKWDKDKLWPQVAGIRQRQGHLQGRMKDLGFSFRSEATLSTLTADVVKSCAIEGEKLDAQEVRSSIARRLGLDYAGTEAVNRNVEGIVEMMLDATQNFAQPLTPGRLFGWHAALFPAGYSGLSRITVGAWRPPEAGAMQVVSGPLGRETVHFVAPPAERLDDEMAAFLEWFEAQDGVDSILKAGVAHFWFVTIHPFEDGNGRIARAIADMALARADGTPERFYSMSDQIEVERKDYYLQLERSQRSDLDITPWLQWFLACLTRALEQAEETISGVLWRAKIWHMVNQGPVNERQQKVLNKVLMGFEGKLTSSKYAKMAKCSEDTALRDIRILVDRGVLVKNEGGGRNTSYGLAKWS